MKILIIEDEEAILKSLEKNLKAEMFTVESTDDGQTGYELALKNDYDLVLLDNILPRLNGIDICRKLRQEERTMPILMLSVKSEINTKVNLLNAGADDYLTKPFAYEELIARIRALLRRGEKIESEVVNIDNLMLDSKRHLVTFFGQELTLTKKEYLLLEYLMRNKGIVLSRGMILEHVWDINADPFSNTIESHIGSLRKKLLAINEQEIILTVPGMGYKIK